MDGRIIKLTVMIYVLLCLKHQDNFRFFVYSAIKSKPKVTKQKFKFHQIRKKSLKKKHLIMDPIPIFCQKVWDACFMKCLQNETDTTDDSHDR